MSRMRPDEVQAQTGYKQELKRTLKVSDLLVYGMVFMVPIAPMAVYGYVSQKSYGMVPLVYLVGIIAMIFTALSYRQMSRRFPIAGSVYSYVQRGLNPHVGFVAGWMILADYLLVPALLYAFSATWLHSMAPGVPNWIWVLMFVIFNTIVTGRGITFQAKTNFVLLGIELIALVIFLIFAIKYVLIDGHGAGGFSLQPLFQAKHFGFGFIATATSIAVLSFLGFDGISTLAEETDRPEKTVGTATVLALVLLGVIFMLETYMAALVHPNYQSLDPNMGFFNLSKEAGGNFLYFLLLIVNVIGSGIANALAGQSAISRILYSMGRDQLLPFSGVLSKIHPKYQTPLNATLFVAGVSALIAIFVPQEKITTLVNFGALTSFMLLNLTVFVYFYLKQRQYTHIFKYLLFPILGLVIVGYVWTGFDRVTFTFGLSWLVIGIIVGAVKSKGYRLKPGVLKDI